MAPQPPQQTTPLTPPSTPPTPKAPLPEPLPTTTTAAVPAQPLRLSPSSISSSSSPSSSSSFPSRPSGLPRITITLNNRPIPALPWRPCNPQRPRYESLYLAPPRQSELSRQHRRQLPPPPPPLQRNHARQAQQQADDEELLLRDDPTWSVPEGPETAAEALSVALLRPIAGELVRWRLLTFYGSGSGNGAAEAKARANVLAADVDWPRTWVVLRAQRARYAARDRRSWGLWPRLNLRGLEVLRVVRRAAAGAGVGAEQLVLAVEAFAEREGGDRRRVSVAGLVARREWGVLAGVLLMDREMMQGREREVVFPPSRPERDGVLQEICRKREEVARRCFSGLEYEEPCGGFCCFASGRKRRVVYQLSRREQARLDGSLELQRQLRRAAYSAGTGPARRESQSEGESDNGNQGRGDGPEVQAQKKHVRISEDVGEEQEARSPSASRASWDSEENRQKRRQERREFVLGKEDEDEDETDEQREEQERTRKQSLERILAANAKWNEEYADR